MVYDIVVLVPDPSGTLVVVDLLQFLALLDSEDYDEAILNSGIDSIDTNDIEAMRQDLARVDQLNRTHDVAAYWGHLS